MKRDSIFTGRRPNGLCGSALLVAAKLHGITISVKKMVSVVHISHGVILKRLLDVKRTQSANLTYEDFFSPKLEKQIESDPPSFIRAREVFKRRDEIEKQNHMLTEEVIQHVIKTNQDIETIRKLRESVRFWVDDYDKNITMLKIPKRKRGRPRKNLPENEEFQALPASTQILDPTPDFALSIKTDEDLGVPIISGFTSDEEVNNVVLSPQEIAARTKEWDAEYGTFCKKQEQRTQQKLLQNELKTRRNTTGPRKRLVGLSKAAQEHLISGALKSKATSGKDLNAIFQNIPSVPNGLDTTEDFIAVCIDRKRSGMLLDNAVPEHIQRKYDDKYTSEPNVSQENESLEGQTLQEYLKAHIVFPNETGTTNTDMENGHETTLPSHLESSKISESYDEEDEYNYNEDTNYEENDDGYSEPENDIDDIYY
ncbi:Transcription factor IIIB 90 kDa subunit [Thelohanellus kitauei]|uniref:Transcription factor IIIB 90 kDa subunit n=1 Tax=Thelohanellus kitauei TaxID=669202 RepID=A0A0C2IQ20_THEKT|nr:Transcription factor IIIB 90 kDa subunit [Thelohanellus kitauei]